jgi:hypothetical protein
MADVDDEVIVISSDSDDSLLRNEGARPPVSAAAAAERLDAEGARFAARALEVRGAVLRAWRQESQSDARELVARKRALLRIACAAGGVPRAGSGLNAPPPRGHVGTRRRRGGAPGQRSGAGCTHSLQHSRRNNHAFKRGAAPCRPPGTVALWRRWQRPALRRAAQRWRAAQRAAC